MKLLGSILFFCFCLTLFPMAATGQTPSASPSPSSQQSALATQTAEYTLPPDKLAKSKALYDLGGKLRIVDTVYGLLILLALLYFGIAARYRDWAEKTARIAFLRIAIGSLSALALLSVAIAVLYQFEAVSHFSKVLFYALLCLMILLDLIAVAFVRSWAERYTQALVFVALFLVTTTVLQLPLDAYQHSISRQYGLSVQGWASWFGDVFKGMLVGYVFLTIVAWVIATLIRVSPRRWWLYSWAIIYALVVFVVAISPVVIDPLFNKFEPLDKTNPQLVDAIEKVTQRGGLTIPRDRMFLMKASEKVTTLNAYVTGFGPSKRVVVWDTTIKNATTPETLFVYGHEMGHYVLNHILIGIAATAIGLFIGFYLLYRIANWAFPRFQQRWRMRELSDWAALVMLILIFSIMGTLSAPIGNGFSRQLEHNADIYGLEVTHGINPNPQETAAHTFQILGELSLTYPYPSKFVVFWYYNHPSIPDRVRFAHNYDPWSKGEQPKYVK